MREYRTKQGDTLASIAHKLCGDSSAVVQILEANRKRRLSDMPAILPAGVVVLIPEIEAREKPQVRIWD